MARWVVAALGGLGVVCLVLVAAAAVNFVVDDHAFDHRCSDVDRKFLLSRAADVAPKTGSIEDPVFIDDCSFGATGSANWDSIVPRSEVVAMLEDDLNCRPTGQGSDTDIEEFSCVIRDGDVIVWRSTHSFEMGMTREPTRHGLSPS